MRSKRDINVCHLRTVSFCMLLLFSCRCWHLTAQDIHFSLLDHNPVLYNPGYAGFFEGRGRFGLAYRTQWGTVSKPYTTFAATAELSLYRNRFHHSGFNAGLYFFRDQAGSLHYGNTAANGILSYYISPSGSDDHYVSVALEFGFGQTGFNATDADMYDATETFERDKNNYLNLGVGVAWFYQPSELFTYRFALSARNINRPEVRYLDYGDSRIPIRWNIYGRMDWRCFESVALAPVVAVQYQHPSMEIYYGLNAKWYVREDRDLLAFGGGLMMRHADAIIVSVLAEYNAFSLALSYDANISKLASASRSFGALEVGLVYRILPARRRIGRISCPVM